MGWGALAGGIAGGLISTGGSLWANKKNRDASNKQNAIQYDLARNSIKYRVEDAKRSGIHPLYALGGQTMGSTVSLPTQQNPMADLGQSIASYRTPKKVNAQLEALQLEGAKADLQNKNISNDLLQQEYNRNKVKGALDLKALSDKKQIKVMGETVKKSKGWSDAEKIETRYGDLLSWPYGIGVLGADALESYQEWSKNRKPYKPKKNRRAHHFK